MDTISRQWIAFGRMENSANKILINDVVRDYFLQNQITLTILKSIRLFHVFSMGYGRIQDGRRQLRVPINELDKRRALTEARTVASLFEIRS